MLANTASRTIFERLPGNLQPFVFACSVSAREKLSLERLGAGKDLARIMLPLARVLSEESLMLMTKSWLALCAIAAGGFLNASFSQPGLPHARAFPSPVDSRQSGLMNQPSAPTADDMQKASETALIAEIRHDLRDNTAKLRLSEFRFDQASNRSLEGKSQGLVLFDQTSAIPISATVIYDLPSARIEQVCYEVNEPAQQEGTATLGKQMRAHIADLIGSRLVLEFSQQPVDFSLLGIDNISRGRDRIVISGNGITRFPGEGAAYTRFIAVADKFSGRILTLKYDLQQEIQPNAAATFAQTN